jgi:hypothetical protein
VRRLVEACTMDRTRMTRAPALFAAALAMIGAATASCGDGGGGSGGSGAAGGSPSSSSAGGTGGTGGGPPVVTCLDAKEYEGLFTVEDPAFCVVAVYQADEPLGFHAPSWGAHHGPLTFRRDTGSSAVDLVRWTAPASATGALTKKETNVDAKIPADAFESGLVTDLPFAGWTALGWAAAFPATDGQLVLVKDGAVDQSYVLNAPYAFVGVAKDADHGRVLHASLSALGDVASMENGLYAADTCAGTPATLADGTDPACAPLLVAAWGDASGPLAVDRDGNAFAVLPTIADGTQEARGFAAPLIAHGAGPTPGDTLFTIPGFGNTVAAITPTATGTGRLVFQPSDSTTFAALDVVAEAYSASASEVKAEGAPATFLELATPGTTLYLFTDEQDRLWVAVPSDASTTFVVIQRTP